MATDQSTTVSAPVEYRDLAPLGFIGYRVGDDGSVWSRRETFNPPGGGGWRSRLGSNWKRLATRVSDNGYAIVGLSNGKRSFTRLVHRLVLEAFIGSCPNGQEGCHGDGDRSNNSLTNLRWDTPHSNWTDRERHGRGCRGERSASAKLTEAQVVVIWTRCSAGEAQRVVAKDIGISHGQVGAIMSGRKWRHVTEVLKSRQVGGEGSQ